MLKLAAVFASFLGTFWAVLATKDMNAHSKHRISEGREMTSSLKVSRAIAAVSALTASSILLSGGIASAQSVNSVTNTDVVIVNSGNANGFGGAYIGAGPSGSVTNGGQANTSALFGGNIQGRINIPNTPISARGSVLFGPNNAAIVPMLTYDVPVARNTNVYVGGGYSFVEDKQSFGVKKNTPIGNKNAPVVVVGAEHSVTRDIVVYGDVKLGIRAYENSPASAVNLTAGAGYRF
ncbi:hypothetical protein OsccyDRAFT_1563 [Leptolyngbyaceae cyanobacterium JSC-12]|nr:hypothetical protein OsccyDRAFT_1563 [Leptolyngbyaceae cyanobacterium JSC-12]